MLPTQNDLPKSTREKIIKLCGERLADLMDLFSQAKQAHWNVKGPSFIALHELFDQVAGDVGGYVDDVAERIVQLGGIAAGTVRDAAKASSLPAYPHDILDGLAHVKALSAAIAASGKEVRAAISISDEIGDQDTADLFTGISRGLDKSLWFVEAHAHARQ